MASVADTALNQPTKPPLTHSLTYSYDMATEGHSGLDRAHTGELGRPKASFDWSSTSGGTLMSTCLGRKVSCIIWNTVVSKNAHKLLKLYQSETKFMYGPIKWV